MATFKSMIIRRNTTIILNHAKLSSIKASWSRVWQNTTRGAGTANPSRAQALSSEFTGVRDVQFVQIYVKLYGHYDIHLLNICEDTKIYKNVFIWLFKYTYRNRLLQRSPIWLLTVTGNTAYWISVKIILK